MFSFSSAGTARVVLALAIGAVAAAPLRAQSTEEKFRTGADLFFRGKAEEALKVFQEVLAENPSNEEALKLYGQAGKEVFALMLMKGGEFETTAKRFLELATIARKEKTNDAAVIAPLVEKAISGNYLEQRDALYELSANHGEYGAAPFIAFLGDEDQEKRVAAIYCLTHMGGDAVLPLVAALGSGDDRVIRNACACLGVLRDVRAIPTLKQVYETGGSDVSRAAANEALRSITGRDASALPPSTALHVEAATRYFRNDQTVRSPFETTDAVWSWGGEGVTATQVPASVRKLRLAGQHCLAAKEDPQAQAILLAAYAAEKSTLAGANEGGSEGESSDGESSEGEGAEGGASGGAASLDVRLAAGGANGLSAALAFALANDAPLAAVELLKALEACGAATDAMRSALGAGVKAVRYQAAFSLASTGDTSAPVVEALGEALGEDALRIALVVDDRSESRNSIAEALRSAGYSVLTADSGALGFARARTIPPKDVVIVRAGMADITVDQFVYDSDYRTSTSSILLLTEAGELDALKALYEGKGKVKGFVTDPIAADALVESVKANLPDLNHERTAALSAAERAAGILGHVPGTSLQPVQADLVNALSRTEETVLGGVLKAVGHLGPAEAAPAVAAIFADTARSEAIRVAAADALGGIFARMSSPPAEDVIKPVMDAAENESNAAIRLAAARALGSASFLAPGDRAKLLAQ